MRKQVLAFIVFLSVFFSCPTLVQATSLNGTVTQVYQDKHYVFRDGNTAKGYVRLNNGFTILAAASVGLDTFVTVSGAIDLRTSGQLDLRGDLFLDAHVTWSRSGNIYGRGNAIHLSGSLSLPTDTIVQFIDDTIIDGHGHALTLGAHAQLLLASDVSLTLRNMTIQTTRNSSNIPIIRCFDQKGHVTLDNVELALADDFPFRTGRMFFKNDVVMTGTSCFIYQSVMQSYVAPQSLLTFDPGTTLYYYPSTFEKDLIQLQSKSAGIYLKGSSTTLQTTHTGMRLSKGRMWLDNKVTVSTRANTTLTSITQVDTASYGATGAYSIDFSPNGRFVAVVGEGGGATSVQVYSFDGAALTSVATANFGGTENKAFCTRWSIDGQYLAVVGGYPNNFKVYGFDGTSLTLLATVSLSSVVDIGNAFGLAWSFDQQYIIVGTYNPTPVPTGDGLQVYRFSGTPVAASLTFVTGLNIAGPSLPPFSCSWHPTNSALVAVGVGDGTFKIYSFNGSSLTLVTSVTYGAAASVLAVKFSPDGHFLAVGGNGPTNGNELQVYSFNGTTCALVDSLNYGTQISPNSVQWDSTGRYISLSGRVPTNGNEFQIFQFNGSSLTLVTSSNYGSNSNGHAETSWSKDGKYIALCGQGPAAGHDEIEVYSVSYRFDTTTQALTNGLTLGNSVLGSSFDLDTYVLSGATVNLAGQLFYDSTS
ncbi:WD40 repeat domain-containing protein [Candidatus Babeliales bacterium]|nr:WD40 repeat domain-containing protein [Candidatus Babeliales bacterium]